MSRAFVKELDGDEHPETLPPRLVSPHPNYVTPQGLEQLDRQIAELKAEWRKLRKAETLESRRRLAEVQLDVCCKCLSELFSILALREMYIVIIAQDSYQEK